VHLSSTIIGLMILPKSSNRGEIHDLHRAGIGIHLDFADVAAGRKVKLAGS